MCEQSRRKLQRLLLAAVGGALVSTPCPFPLACTQQAVLLAGFIRTGAWAGPAGERLLEISMQQQQPVSQLSTGALGGGSGLPACANSSAVVIDPLLPPTSQPEGFSPSGEEGGAAVAESSNECQASPSGSGSGSSSTATLTVRLKGGKVGSAAAALS